MYAPSMERVEEQTNVIRAHLRSNRLNGMSKIFVVGLPRTGTTSLCAKCLEWEFRVAHCALSKEAFRRADVIADTPVFSDYEQLDALFPDSRFIYLHRAESEWIPSIKLLLTKMAARYRSNTQMGGGFHPLILRSFDLVFPHWMQQETFNEEYLFECYDSHRKAVREFFNKRKDTAIELDLSGESSETQLKDFLQRFKLLPTYNTVGFERLNRNGKINSWQAVKHPLKVDSMAFGDDRRNYFDYIND